MSIKPVHFDGKSNPMTVITPMRVRWRWFQRLVIAIFRRLSPGFADEL